VHLERPLHEAPLNASEKKPAPARIGSRDTLRFDLGVMPRAGPSRKMTLGRNEPHVRLGDRFTDRFGMPSIVLLALD
jgi:hypothetical protein